jgi:hypothetical protein
VRKRAKERLGISEIRQAEEEEREVRKRKKKD